MATGKEVDEKIRKPITENVELIFTQLEKFKLLIHQKGKANQTLVRQFVRIWTDQDNLRTKTTILQNPETFKKYLDANAAFGLTEEIFMFDLMRHMASFYLSEIEMLKKIFRDMLDLKRLNLNPTATLGEMLEALSKRCGINKQSMKQLFNVEFRDALAHDSWYFENRKFTYKTKGGKIEQWTIDEFGGELISLSVLTEQICLKYLKKFEPDKVSEAEKWIKEKTKPQEG